MQHASEINQLVQQLRAGGKKVCVAGISMGGHVTFAQLRMAVKPDLVAPFLATPDFRTRDAENQLPPSPAETCGPVDHIDDVFPVSLFMVAAGSDTVVRPYAVRSFAEKLRPLYQSTPEKLEYHEYEHSEHMMRPADWFDAWEKFTERLQREGF